MNNDSNPTQDPIKQFLKRESVSNQYTLYAASGLFGVGLVWMLMSLQPFSPLPEMSVLEFLQFAWDHAPGPSLMLGACFLLTGIFMSRSIEQQLSAGEGRKN